MSGLGEPRPGEPGRAGDDADLAELQLAQTLVALHRAEQAPRTVRDLVESRL